MVIFSFHNGFSQISVYDCNAINSTVTQAEIDVVSYEYYNQCITFGDGNNYLFNGSSNKKVTAATEIKLQPDFHAGAYNATGGMHLNILPKSNFDVAVMNYTSLNSVLRYEKLELGVQLPQVILDKVNNFVHEIPIANHQKLNPFIDRELKVQAVFSHTSGLQKSIDGFYFREMSRDIQNNEWDDLGTNYPFRIRFAPPQNGNWKCTVKIFVNEQLAYESVLMNFTVIESGNKGYVRVHANEKNLMHGNEIIYPVGQNLPFPYDYDNLLYSGNPNEKLNVIAWQKYAESINNYGEMGGKYIRTILSPSCSDIEFEKIGNYYDRLNYAWEMDQIITNCEEKDMMVSFNMMLHKAIMVAADYGQYAWDFGKFPVGSDNMPSYCYQSHFNFQFPHEMVFNPESMYFMKQRYRYIISRWGYSTNIYMFELISEPWHFDENANTGYKPYHQDDINGIIARNAAEEFQSKLSEYIKIQLNHNEHLIGSIGFTSGDNGIYPHDKDLSNPDETWSKPNIDLILINDYSSEPNKLLIKKNFNDNNSFGNNSLEENSMAYNINRLHYQYKKPVFITEFGHGEMIYQNISYTVNECSNNTGHYVDLMTGGFVGAAGFSMWDGFTENKYHLWPSVIFAQNHLNSYDVINTLSVSNGAWIQGRQMEKRKDCNEIVEHQYYLSGNQERAAGFVKNRTYNRRTTSAGGACSLDFDQNDCFNQYESLVWNNKKNLYIEGLKSNTDYKITWYNFKTGAYIFEECQNTNGTKLKLKFPTLYVDGASGQTDRPIVWYVVKQENCDKSLIVDTTNEELENPTIRNLDFEINPNPVSDELNISAPFSCLAMIYNIDGRFVKEIFIDKATLKINVSDLNQGSYFIVFGGVLVKKFIKL